MDDRIYYRIHDSRYGMFDPLCSTKASEPKRIHKVNTHFGTVQRTEYRIADSWHIIK